MNWHKKLLIAPTCFLKPPNPGRRNACGNGCRRFGILLHEAIGHTFEADFNRKGTSIFSDKMGKKVAESFVNIIDDGTLENNRGSINVDDEGNDVQKTYLVKDGMLNSYIHDRISSKYYGVEPTGNGRRESFRNIPLATYAGYLHGNRTRIQKTISFPMWITEFMWTISVMAK
jgi:predicted Zn-dependent protease